MSAKKLKLLLIAADSVEPRLIQKYKREFPTLSKMIDSGAFARHFAYTGWNYSKPYKSEQNWSSILTGLTPNEHKLTAFGTGSTMIIFSLQ